MRSITKRAAALIGIAVIILTNLPCRSAIQSYAADSKTSSDYEYEASSYIVSEDFINYTDYEQSFENRRPSAEIRVNAAEALTRYMEGDKETAPELYKDYEGDTGTSVLTSEDSFAELSFEVKEEGFYDLSLVYYPIAGKSSDIERSIFIDDELPFKEFTLVTFHRVWKYALPETRDEAGLLTYEWGKDNQGNDNKPSMIEAPEWMSEYAYDSDGYITKPLSVYLKKGTHTISLLSVREPMLLKEIVFNNAKELKDYRTVKAEYDSAGAVNTTGRLITIEAENVKKTSSQMLTPTQDRSSKSVSPSSSKELLNNSVGGNSWRLVGQWIEWEFKVPESGYYNISLYDKQNFSRGIHVSRRISIDGSVPFEELSAYAFEYENSWREDVLKDEDGTPFYFYLDEGTHTLRMEAVLGDFSKIVGLVQTSVQELNEIYRQVIKVTGVSPDTYRDYQIEATLPMLTDELTSARDTLSNALSLLEEVGGRNTDKKTVLLTMIDQLDDLIDDNEYFVRTISSYKINVRALGNWISSVISQPLQIDRINIYSPDTVVKYPNRGFFAGTGYELSRLFYSFVIDYNNIGSVTDDKESESITLWIGSGRDQANVIKGLIDKTFTKETGIGVNVQLVDMNTLLKASLVGEGPDVAIQVANTNGIAGSVLYTGNDTPVNYGIRNAVLNLRSFDDCDKVLKRFPGAALTQFEYDGAIYALPETITYPVMFYRKDILAEIGLDIPKTWDDVKVAMTVLNKNQMEFGMLANEQLFASLLYQNGGKYYSDDYLKSALDSDIGVDTFKEFCEFYTDYKLDKETSVEERFRTGECPLMIADYTVYNNFSVSAPDIAGLWDFTKIPGTVKENGTIDHSTACTGLASMIMADTEHKDASWEFIKWWTSADTQNAYGREMEGLMGSAARVPTANYEAFLKMPWPTGDFETLKAAMEDAKGIPQVPGGYYSWRNVYNAFYSVVTNPDTTPVREELMDKVIYINAEIEYKREELNLNK